MIYNLHGNIGSTADWDGFPGEPVDLWKYAKLPFWEWAFEFCREVGEKESDSGNYLVGYSLGGRLALHALIAEPDFWDGAVIIGAHPGLCYVEDRMARRTSDAVWAGWAGHWEWKTFLEKWNAQGVLAGGKPSLAQMDLESRREAVAKGFENWSLGAQEDLRERLRSIPTKMLWVTGEEDVKFSSIGQEMAATIPNCEHVLVEDCGHRVIFDQPEVLSKLVAEFAGE